MSRTWKHSSVRLVLCLGLAATALVTGTRIASAQVAQGSSAKSSRQIPIAAENVMNAANREALTQLEAVERVWREAFREARKHGQLKKFVDETLGLLEKLRQVQDLAVNPNATNERISTLFRQRIMNEVVVNQGLEQSLAGFCKFLDEQDQALLIKLKIDRAATRTNLSRTAIDREKVKRSLDAATSKAVVAVKDDLARSVVSFVASEVIGTAAKRAARQMGVMPGEQGSLADFIGGFLIDQGVNMAVDAAFDPTSKMVANLEAQLIGVERSVLDGDIASPGFLSTLRQLTNERIVARRKLIEDELSK